MSKTLVTVMFLLALLMHAAVSRADGTVMLLDIDGAIGPATGDFVHRGLQRADREHAVALVLRINTPGGLDSSMRDIVRDILASPVPVVSYVAPGGARAASAGTFILYASHVAAMAPGTNLGAATPVNIAGRGRLPGADPLKKPDGGEEAKDSESDTDATTSKAVNDAAAYIRSLAQLRGRNLEWAEKAVREAASLSAAEALQEGVIDLVAVNLEQLLTSLDKRRISLPGGEVELGTAGVLVVEIQPDWRTRLLSVIADPNIAYILILIGIYGLIFEFYNPGFVVPGVVGAICLITALFALQVLPVNYAGLGLLILGIVFMVAEAFAPSFGALGIGGLIAFAIGSVLLIDTDMPGYGVSLPLIVTASVISGIFFLGIIGMAIRARERPVVSGQEELLHAIGVAMADFQGNGRVRIHGETWNAASNVALKRGQQVRVTGIEGLVLQVEPLAEE